MLVVSLCDGVGGAFVAAKKAGWFVKGLAAESDQSLRDLVARRHEDVVHVKDVREVTAELVMKHCSQRGCAFITLVGGPPCQPFSAAGKKGAFRDSRSGPLVHFCELRKDLVASYDVVRDMHVHVLPSGLTHMHAIGPLHTDTSTTALATSPLSFAKSDASARNRHHSARALASQRRLR